MPTTTNSTGTDTQISQESPASSRTAKMMPPMHMIGVDTMKLSVISTQHLHLLHVVGVAGDQRGVPQRPTSSAVSESTLR